MGIRSYRHTLLYLARILLLYYYLYCNSTEGFQEGQYLLSYEQKMKTSLCPEEITVIIGWVGKEEEGRMGRISHTAGEQQK